jgi:hypothetical protein
MTIVRSKEQAEQLISTLERKLARTSRKHKLSDKQRANFLVVRASLYAAIGDPRMLETALEAYEYTKNSNTAAVLAMAYHHHCRMDEAAKYYKLAYDFPHEAGWEVDLSYSQSLLMQGRWSEAYPIIKSLKKRMVYAAYLPDWLGEPCDEVQIISEGGFGDLVHMSRYLPMVTERVKKVTVFLPDMFYDLGFVDLARQQPWFPEIKHLTEAVAGIHSAGFFDFPWIFNTQPDAIPFYPELWRSQIPGGRKQTTKPLGGFCWAARAYETPICPSGVYRAMKTEQAQKIVDATKDSINWVGLQKGEKLPSVFSPALNNWNDTANIIANLDFVCTVDTAVAHLAAAMGKPTIVILSGAVDWKFGLDDDGICPWYPTWQIIRNNAFGFDNAVDKTIKFLQERVGFSDTPSQNRSASAG